MRHYRHLLTLLVLGIAACQGSDRIASPDFSTGLFSADVIPLTQVDCKNGGWESHGFKNQGQCVRFVETGIDSRDEPQASPDILLVHNATQFWLLDISSRSDARVLSTKLAGVREGDLHPDGDRVIYRTVSAGHTGVEFRMSTGEQTASTGEAWYPSYSLGGDSVVASVTGSHTRIYQLRPTEAQTDVGACSNGFARFIDGDTKLLCATNTIWTYDLASGTSTPISFARPASWVYNEWLDCPRMSPDGTTISFFIEIGTPGQHYLVNRDGSNLRAVGPGGSTLGCWGSWSPREPLLALIKGGAIQVFDIAGALQSHMPLPIGVTATNVDAWR